MYFKLSQIKSACHGISFTFANPKFVASCFSLGPSPRLLYTAKEKRLRQVSQLTRKLFQWISCTGGEAILPLWAELSGCEPQLEPLVKTVAVTALFTDSKMHKYTCTSSKRINKQIQTLWKQKHNVHWITKNTLYNNSAMFLWIALRGGFPFHPQIRLQLELRRAP